MDFRFASLGSGSRLDDGVLIDDARKVIEGIYQAGLDNLRKLFGG